MNDINTEISIAFQATQLILVFLTVLFSLRYPQITKILDEEIPEIEKPIARARLIKKLKKVFFTNMPLLLISIISSWLFLPLFFKIIFVSKFALWNFDFSRSSFVFIAILIFLFTAWIIKLMVELVIKIHNIKKGT